MINPVQEIGTVEGALATLRRALDEYAPDVALASSFSAEDVVLIHMAVSIRKDARIIAVDTGRLPEETYECAEAIRRHLGVSIEWFFPDREAVERLAREGGLYSFRESVEARRACCRVRKVEPLDRALRGLRAWVTGLRRTQGPTRASIEAVERDDAHGGIAKFNPLAAWTWTDVLSYVRAHHLPMNRLYGSGYVSIGCAPCTRAVAPGEDPRAGRWWWEDPERKECGIHLGRRRP